MHGSWQTLGCSSLKLNNVCYQSVSLESKIHPEGNVSTQHRTEGADREAVWGSWFILWAAWMCSANILMSTGCRRCWTSVCWHRPKRLHIVKYRQASCRLVPNLEIGEVNLISHQWVGVPRVTPTRSLITSSHGCPFGPIGRKNGNLKTTKKTRKKTEMWLFLSATRKRKEHVAEKKVWRWSLRSRSVTFNQTLEK